ncbi:MAG: hypothetical protein WAT09_14905 [Paracoccaceae bacterium]
MTLQDAGFEQILQRTATELQHCRVQVQRLERAVHALLDGPKALVDPAILGDLQAMDLLDQKLDGLARWTSALATAAAGLHLCCPISVIAQAVPLADLRASLTGGAGMTHAASSHAELF